LVLVLVLFGGRGKISSVMGDLAKGITSFRKGLKDEETPGSPDPQISDRGETIDASPSQSTQQSETTRTES
jgi:sec-independent protein translocase protein TatA